MSANYARMSGGLLQLPILLGTDQHETCRNCGSRTEFDELTNP